MGIHYTILVFLGSSCPTCHHVCVYYCTKYLYKSTRTNVYPDTCLPRQMSTRTKMPGHVLPGDIFPGQVGLHPFFPDLERTIIQKYGRWVLRCSYLIAFYSLIIKNVWFFLYLLKVLGIRFSTCCSFALNSISWNLSLWLFNRRDLIFYLICNIAFLS